LDTPVTIQPDGIKLKPEKMNPDQLYHCLFEGRVFLFFKDHEELLHCYEVQDPAAIKEICENPLEIESILRKHSDIDTGFR
jgi:hypothetical protein